MTVIMIAIMITKVSEKLGISIASFHHYQRIGNLAV